MICSWELIAIPKGISNGLTSEFQTWRVGRFTNLIFVIFKKARIYTPGEWDPIYIRPKSMTTKTSDGISCQVRQNIEKKLVKPKNFFNSKWVRDFFSFPLKSQPNIKKMRYNLLIVSRILTVEWKNIWMNSSNSTLLKIFVP